MFLRIKQAIYRQLDFEAVHNNGLTLTSKIIIFLIAFSCLVIILESEDHVRDGNEQLFLYLEYFFISIFTVEYLFRLWACTENPKYSNGLKGRLRYIVTPSALFDLLAIAPALFLSFGTDAFLLRFIRLLRLLRIAKLGRFSQASQYLIEAVKLRQYELYLSLAVAGILLIVSSTLLYLFEAETQPDVFGSIPRAMWWSLVTLTTIGYGDVVPVTIPGRFFAGMTGIMGIGLIAMPTGILASAFSDVIQKHNRSSND